MCCGGVQTCAGSFPLLLFLPTYAAFFHGAPAVSRIPTPQPPPPSSSTSSSSSSSSASLLSAETTMCVCAAHTLSTSMERTVGQHRCTSGNVESYLCRWQWWRGGEKASRRQGISATDEQTTTIATGECDSGHWDWWQGGG